MGRQSTYQTTLATGKIVGYSVKARHGTFKVKFKDASGKYIEPSTGVEVPKTWTPDKDPPNTFFVEAAKVIVKAFTNTEHAPPITSNWERAITHLEGTPDLRPESVRGYLTAVTSLRKIITTKGPSDITQEHAQQWKREFLGGTYARGHDTEAKTYKRSPTSFNTYLRSLRSLWNAHWKPAGFVRQNPWEDLTYANAAKGKRVRHVEEPAVQSLLDWLTERYPDWHTPRLFVEVKMLAGCRTLDLCKTLSKDLEGTTLTLTAEVTKTRTPRTVELREDLAEKLHDIKGNVYLWEATVKECQKHRPARLPVKSSEYTPETWRNTIQNLFREFNETRAKKDHVRPHDLRARAITLVAAATQSVDATAEALGVDPQTARHYMDRAKAFSGSDIMKKLANVLLPNAPQSPHNPPQDVKPI